MQIPFLSYRIVYRTVDPLVLPEFPGSTFRGVFGKTSKRLACISLAENCELCHYQRECLYATAFETRPPFEERPPFPGNARIPHPFILRPAAGLHGQLQRGDTFSLELTVFGSFMGWSHYFLKSLQIMGGSGAGKGNGQFVLENVADRIGGSVIFQDGRLLSEPTPGVISLDPVDTHASIQLQTLSILRMVKRGHLIRDLTPEILITEASRRFHLLAHYYGETQADYDYRATIAASQHIRYKSDLTLKKIKRYSNRHRKYLPLDGLEGTLTMQNVPPVNYMLLKALEEIHLGKSTVMGLGQVRIWNC